MKNEINNLKVAVVPQEFLDRMEQEILEIKQFIRKKTEEERGGEYNESVKVPKILNVSRKTFQEWRNRKLLNFVQIGHKIYIKRSDLEDFMEAHKIYAKN